MGRRPRALSWRQLNAQLALRGLPQHAGESHAGRLSRLHETGAPTTTDGAADGAPAANGDSGAASGPAAAAAVVQLVPALVGGAVVLDRLQPLIQRFGGKRIARQAALVPAQRLHRLQRALTRRQGPALIAVAPAARYTEEPDPALWAAAQLALRLAERLGLAEALRPPALQLVPLPIDRLQAAKARSLLRLWLAALDSASDAVAELSWEPPAPPADSPGSDALRDALLRAVAEQRCVRVRYAGRERGSETVRTLEPLAVERQHGQEYLRAYCRWREAERLFRFDRFRAVELLPERFGGDGEPGPGVSGV